MIHHEKCDTDWLKTLKSARTNEGVSASMLMSLTGHGRTACSMALQRHVGVVSGGRRFIRSRTGRYKWVEHEEKRS